MGVMILLSIFFSMGITSCNAKVDSPQKNTDMIAIDTNGLSKATFAGGCFWCTEAIFTELKGVQKVVPGYTGGREENPTYKQVSNGLTGHAEAIQIYYDPTIISYATLLEVFFSTHDPTTLNRQGNDVGAHYRSAIFYHDEAQKKEAENAISQVAPELWEDPIVTEVKVFERFYPAEEYHVDYFAQNPGQPYCAYVINPKVQKFRKKYANLLKS